MDPGNESGPRFKHGQERMQAKWCGEIHTGRSFPDGRFHFYPRILARIRTSGHDGSIVSMKRFRSTFILFFWLAAAGQASAGMTVITLTDLARARLDALSFFLVTYLVISWLVKIIWNQLAKSFTVLPRLKYLQALAVVFTTGLMFYVVLTMISGARELLTPGAWEKQGMGYRMREAQAATLNKEERRKAMGELQTAIWIYAKTHDGNAPASVFTEGIDPSLWNYGDGGLYCLMPGVRPGGGRDILVYEPAAAGGRRFILLADGSIEDRSESNLKDQINQQIQR